MHKVELLKQLSDVLEDGTDVKKVIITYKNGEAMKIAFYEDEDKDDNDNVIIADKVENNEVIQETGWKVSIR